MIDGEPGDFWGNFFKAILVNQQSPTTGATWQNRFATTEAEPLKGNSPTDKDLARGVVQQGSHPHGINVRGVAIVDILVDVYNRFAKDVADATYQPHPIGKFDVANVAVWKERRQGVIP
ncbi:unnamed protein product [marine sediment metagenome]|uniref:Uncharacterized protein n=1 Tax=marine sediment metagenome TaxID=412755 RepID=X1LJN7_9ZZZZ